jgi:hypothetical protein
MTILISEYGRIGGLARHEKIIRFLFIWPIGGQWIFPRDFIKKKLNSQRLELIKADRL